MNLIGLALMCGGRHRGASRRNNGLMSWLFVPIVGGESATFALLGWLAGYDLWQDRR